MGMNPRSSIAIVLCLASALASGAGDASAQTPAGAGQLSGTSVLAVKGCGRDRDPALVLLVTLGPDGSWMAEDQEGARFGGTSAPIGSSGRKLDLSFDAETEAAFRARAAADVGELCQAPATVESAVKKAFTLKLNRKLTRAKLALRYVFTGTAGGIPGRATQRVSTKGPWVPAS
jgi:hypothetical protein